MNLQQFPAAAAVCIVAMVAWGEASAEPPDPIRLKASAPSWSQVDLRWTDDASVGIGFTIERTGDPREGSWSVVGTTGPTARAFSEVGLSPFTTYYYRVSANDAADRLRVSNVVKVKTKQVPPDASAPTVPAQVTAVTGSACNGIEVSWTASTDVGRSGVKVYTVYVSGGSTREIGASHTSAVVAGLAPSGTYSFAVSATDYAGNESARSGTAVARTRADCSGSGGMMRSAAAFSGERSLGSSANCVSVGPDGSTVIGVGQYGSIDYGGGSLTSLGGVDLALVKFGDDGRHLWSRIFGSSGDQSPFGMGIDAQGDIYLTGAFENHIELDDHALDSDGPNPDIFLIKLEAASGRALWARSFGSEGYDKGYALAVDPAGGVVITGYFTDAIDFGGGTLGPAQGADIFIARFTGEGQHLWSKAIGGPGADYARALAIDGAGNLSITGSFEHTVDFGDGHAIESTGSEDIFVASYGLDGVCRWSRGFGGTDDDSGRAIAVDHLGGVVAMGLFVGDIRLDALTVSSSTSGYPEIFLAKFDTDGDVLWARGCGAGIPQGDSALAMDRSGDVVTSVASSGTVDLGGGPLAASTEDVVVARLLPDGRHVWSRRFVSRVGRQNSRAVASARNGDVVLVGLIEGTADYDAAVVTANGPVLLRLGP